MRTAVIVPTLNAGSDWEAWISALMTTGINASDVYIVDSGSIDNTVQLATMAGFSAEQIESGAFNHGGTRHRAVSCIAGYDLVVFFTQDAILSDTESIKNILLPFRNDKVSAVCGRQLPRRNAGVIEMHARLFNYRKVSSINTIQDVSRKGLKTAFISNSFAAYRVSALNEVGGFPSDVIFGEDMYVATKMLMAGHKIAYAADACVYHSHDYSILQEFNRYFDMGVFHAREPWIMEELGGAEGEGIKFVISEFNYLLKHAFWRVPEVLLRTVFRYAGFRLGLAERRLPLWLKRRLAMNEGYFK